jgi:hypothetical protein
MVADDAHPQTPTREADTLRRLLRDQGVRRYGLFFVTGAGTTLPAGSEDASGSVVDEHGRVVSFSTGWDVERAGVTFTRWDEVTPEPEWAEDDEEYQAARREAGLAGA